MSDRNKEPRIAPLLLGSADENDLPLVEPEQKIFEELSWYWSLASRGKLNRRVVLGLTAGFLGGLGLLLSRGLTGVASAAEKDDRVATALFAEGLLTVIRPDGSTKRLAGQGSLPLYEGDKLQTGRVSQGYILFKDGTSMALNANTTIIIRSRKDKKGTIQMIKLFIGEIWAQIGEKTKRFEIETPNALAAVSGTEFGESYYEETSILTVGEGEMGFGTYPTHLMTYNKLGSVDKETLFDHETGARTDADKLHDELGGMDDIPPENRIKVEAGFQSRIEKLGRPTEPVMADTDRLLNWGRSLHARFRPRKAKGRFQRGGFSRSSGFTRRREREFQINAPSRSNIINPY